MKLLLTHLVNANYFTISTLNDRLRRFDFGYIEQSDIPSMFDEKTFLKNPEQKIRQSASKMWLLAIMLPLLVGDLVPEDCEEWNLFIILLRICVALLAPGRSHLILPLTLVFSSKSIILSLRYYTLRKL